MNETYKLHKEMEAATALREALDQDDAELLRDAIEGETNLREMIQTTVLSLDEDMTLVDGLFDHIKSLQERLARLRRRVDYKRAAIEQAMTIAELKTLELPTMTATIRRLKPGLQILDEALIPSEFWKDKDPTLDRSALKKALDNGARIPGADLDNGSIALQLRRN